MSFTERRARSAEAEPFAAPRAPLSERQIERRERRLRLVRRRQDIAIGALIALTVLVLGPGLAVAAISAVIALLVLGVWFAIVRLRGRRSGGRRRRRFGRRR